MLFNVLNVEIEDLNYEQYANEGHCVVCGLLRLSAHKAPSIEQSSACEVITRANWELKWIFRRIRNPVYHHLH